MTFSFRSKSNRPVWSRLLASAAMAAALSLAACATPTASSSGGKESKPVIDTYQAAAQDVKIRWYRQPALYNNGTSALQNVWLINDTIYFSSADFRLIGIDAGTGKDVMKLNLGYVPNILRPAEWGDYLLCFNSTQGVMVDRRNSKVINRTPLSFAATTSPVVVGSTVCVGSGIDYFYGLYVDLFGKVSWPVRSEERGDSFVSQPVIAGGRRMAIAAKSGRIWCIDPDFGTVIWSDRKVTGHVVGGLGADSRYIYVPSTDNKVFAFDSVDSHYFWDTHLEGMLDKTVVVAKGGRLLVPSTGKGLYCLETETGRAQWLLPDATQIVSLSATHVYVADNSGVVKAVRLNNGPVNGPATDPIPDAKVDKTFTLSHVKLYATNLHGATVYAVNAEGGMMAIEPEEINP